MSPPYSPQEGSYQTYETWSPSNLPYSQTGTGRGRGDSEATTVQESFQNLTLREVPLVIVITNIRTGMDQINLTIVNNEKVKKNRM